MQPKDNKRKLYQYGTIRRLGLLIFLSVFLIWEGGSIIRDLSRGYKLSLYIMIMDIKSSMALFMVFMFPVMLLTSIMVTLSNIKLIRREGRNVKNMLGMILGCFLCISTVLLTWGSGQVTYRADLAALLVDYLFYLLALFVTYIECILFGTVIVGIAAAKHIPEYDKDYVIILGCHVREDGSLTPLLQSRVDRAMEFAATQMEKTGKAPIFVVSGGKGSDESISEAEAMKRYLLSVGIEEDRIRTEAKSTNTEENIQFSTELIRQEKEDAKIAFTTTNYHVFRTGAVADELDIDMEGIGAKTKSYFWINAFIREFVATLLSEKRKHLAVLGTLAVLLFLIQLYVY